MKKRLIATSLTGILAVALLAGCGKGKVYEAVMPTGVEEAAIYVEPIENLSDDFIKGVDISMIIAEENAGAKYKNEAGVEEDIFKILADAGVNYIRVRVWNDPFDENGNGYGGGNCDAKTAAQIGKRAAQYGMKLLVDFHYSDFWADPAKQYAPKAWAGMSAAQKAEAAKTFTYETLETIIEAGADIGMVQVGNETNNGMSGETLWSSITDIMKGGVEAVNEVEAKHQIDIKVAVHFTNVEKKDNIYGLATKLKNYELDYDIFALSYYPYWHGSIDNLKKVMTRLRDEYGKDVMVVETSYAYTLEDGDSTSNSVSEKDLTEDYAATVQSQANEVRDICAAVSEVGGLGVFYWEPDWIPVDESTWESLGTGWASSYASDYDPKDAALYYGGCAWDNQAMFSFDGTALPSLSVWKYLKYGATTEPKIDFVNDIEISVITGEPLEIPDSIEVHYNDRKLNGPAKVTWNLDDLQNCDTNTAGEYQIRGTFEDGTGVKCTVKVAGLNLLANASFEDSDRSMWNFIYEGSEVLDFQQKESDAHSGEWALHYWRSGAVEFKAETTITGLENGLYTVSCYAQGGDNGKEPHMYLYAVSNSKEYKEEYLVDGWVNWKHPEITSIQVTDGTLTVGVSVSAGAGAWGTFDDFYLYKQE